MDYIFCYYQLRDGTLKDWYSVHTSKNCGPIVDNRDIVAIWKRKNLPLKY